MKKLLFMTATLLCVVSCITKKKEFIVEKPIKHVIIVGFDGLSAWSINNGANMPNLRKLMSEGASTTECRSILPSSSACNWASMFMGAGPELHGYNTWGSQKPDLPSRVLTETGIFPNIYSECHRAYPEAQLGYVYEWAGMRYLVDTLAVTNLVDASASGGTTPAVEYIKTAKPDLLAIIYAEPDGAGHSMGWESERYMTTVIEQDKELGKIVSAIEEAGIKDETLLIVASDHGGINTGHGGITMKEMQTPLVFWGAGVKKGYAIDQSVMVYDIASTVLSVKHVPQPQVWIGRPINVFE